MARIGVCSVSDMSETHKVDGDGAIRAMTSTAGVSIAHAPRPVKADRSGREGTDHVKSALPSVSILILRTMKAERALGLSRALWQDHVADEFGGEAMVVVRVSPYANLILLQAEGSSRLLGQCHPWLSQYTHSIVRPWQSDSNNKID
jgi:hypothetical protein